MNSIQEKATGRLHGVTIPATACVDLHMHTTASDGRFTPATLAKAAHEAGLVVIALADHDRVDNVLPLQREAVAYEIHVIPAVEVSCLWDTVQYHMLVYNVDLTAEHFVGPLNEARDKYRTICENGMSELARKAMPLDAGVLEVCHRGQPLAPYHIFQAIIKHEYAPNMKEAHELAKTVGVDFLPLPEMRDVIKRARDTGAIPILAHPARAEPGFSPPSNETLDAMIEAGLMGFEVWHPYHSSYDSARYLKLCTERGLLTSAGSDTHSPNDQRRTLTPWPALFSEKLLAMCGVTIEG
ncbi:MAG: PHP domain-containing protein [Chloroflexota bacterium]|nr:PHP domain-containing protein [Chloroflexota bacterium]